MRLTKEEKIKELATLKKHNVLMTDDDYKELKLGQLEDIEEELGIDLITYFKLFQTTKAWVYSNNGKCEITLTGVNPYDKTVNLWNGVCHIEYPLNEYGKSFALTKEELL